VQLESMEESLEEEKGTLRRLFKEELEKWLGDFTARTRSIQRLGAPCVVWCNAH